MEYFLIFIAAIFVNNIVLSQFLGICPFLGVSKKSSTAAGMGLAVTFMLTVAVIVTYALQNWVLNPYGLGYLQTILFILVIAGLVQMLEIILKKVSPSLYQALGIFLPLITTNCCILGVAILVLLTTFALVHSGAAECLFSHIETAQLTAIADHILVQLQVVTLGIAPHQPGLSVVVNHHRGVNMVPRAILEQRFT